MIAILDYKAGNQTSVRRVFDHLGVPCRITADPEEALKADGIIFPGVGAAGQAMRQIRAAGLDHVLKRAAEVHRPVLGICLGCQIMLTSSEENNTETLGLVDGICKRFSSDLHDESGNLIRIPHMGWNTVERKRQSLLLDGIAEDASFYFVHSYYVETRPELVIGTTTYGTEFCTVYGRDGLWAVQFHPEKSGPAGLKLLANFSEFCKGGAQC